MKRLALLILMCLVIDIPFQVSAQGYRYNNSRYNQNQLYRRTTNSSARQLSGDQKTSERKMPEKKSSKDKNKRNSTDKKDKKKTEGNYSVGEGEIELVVTGEGSGLKEATQNALRSAIEQAYGVFVSSNTTLLNDELVKDEIATISSGNIKAYKELGSMVLPNGKTTVTLSTIVTISKLVSYAQSHGCAAEFAGQTFMMNMKMRELNTENERKVLDNACDELKEIASILYDYSISLGEPKLGRGYELPVCIEVCPNENFKSWMDKFSSTLSAISLSESECAEWEKNGMTTYLFSFFGKPFHLRNRYTQNDALREIIDVFNSFENGWRIVVNNGDITFSPIEREMNTYYLIKNGNEADIVSYRNAAKRRDYRNMGYRNAENQVVYKGSVNKPNINDLWNKNYESISLWFSYEKGYNAMSFETNHFGQNGIKINQPWYLMLALPFTSSEMEQIRTIEVQNNE